MDNITIMHIYIILIIIIILLKLYAVNHHGKLIINAEQNESRLSTIGCAFAIIVLGGLGYIVYKTNDTYNILLDIVLIEISIFDMIKGLHILEIRENGIYGSKNFLRPINFYKWSQVQSYSWILPTTIQFKVNTTFFKTNKSFEFTIKEELKSKATEILQKYVHS